MTRLKALEGGMEERRWEAKGEQRGWSESWGEIVKYGRIPCSLTRCPSLAPRSVCCRGLADWLDPTRVYWLLPRASCPSSQQRALGCSALLDATKHCQAGRPGPLEYLRTKGSPVVIPWMLSSLGNSLVFDREWVGGRWMTRQQGVRIGRCTQ